MSHSNDETIRENSQQSATARPILPDADSGNTLTRRRLMRGAAVVSTGAILLGWITQRAQPTLALSGEDEWVAAGADITSHDGSVDSITFGDPDGQSDPGEDDNRIVLDWSGFDDGSRSVEFDVRLKGASSDDGWNGDQETYESIIVDAADDPASVTISGTNGKETYSWNDVFGLDQPADVEEHPHIELSDFQAKDNGDERERIVDVEIEAHAPGEAITAIAEAEATITVTNRAADISVGGKGTFEISSDTEV